MNIKDFHFVADLLYKRSGLVLNEGKAYLLESRLSSVSRKWKFKTLEELVEALRAKKDSRLEVDVVEAMTTNESFFFRDQTPFNQLRDVVLPGLLEARATRRHIRIWSAACSSGQEPYTIAMILKQMQAKLMGWRIEVIATDISKEILDKAQKGIYTQFEVQRGLPIDMLVKNFEKQGDKWQVNADIREMVKFKYLNLLERFNGLGVFDIVFCRNVLIYFDQLTKAQVLASIAKTMSSDGSLYLGGAETVLGITDLFEPVRGQRGLYGLTDKVSGAATGLKVGLAS